MILRMLERTVFLEAVGQEVAFDLGAVVEGRGVAQGTVELDAGALWKSGAGRCGLAGGGHVAVCTNDSEATMTLQEETTICTNCGHALGDAFARVSLTIF